MMSDDFVPLRMSLARDGHRVQVFSLIRNIRLQTFLIPLYTPRHWVCWKSKFNCYFCENNKAESDFKVHKSMPKI